MADRNGTDKELDLTKEEYSEVETPEIETPEIEGEGEAAPEPKQTKEKEPKEEKKDYKKLSLRDTIRDAKEQEASKEEKEAPKKEAKTDQDNEALKEALSGVKTEKEPVQKTETTNKAPVSWSKEAKAEWDKLPAHVQAAINKREKEASDGFKSYGEKTKRLEELDSVLKPREAAIKQFGVSEAQTVDRLFQWMEALAHPNKQYALQQYLALGKNFGLELPTNSAAPQQQQNNTQQTQETQAPDVLTQVQSQLEPKFQTLEQKIAEFERRDAQAREAQARDFLNNWAKDKPYYEKVRPLMFTLLQNTQLIPLNNGSLDLDKAYEMAIMADPATRLEYEAAEKEKADQKAAEEKRKAELERLRKLNAAKKASTLSTRAPSANIGSNKQPSRKPVSVRDSILAARQEVRENQ